MKALVFLFIAHLSGTIPVHGEGPHDDFTKAVTTPTPHRHTFLLDREGRYKLKWFADIPNQQIYFNVTVQTRGFVLFGIGKRDPNNVQVERQDFIIAGVDSRGRPYFKDMYTIAGKTPVVDSSQDWVLQCANETSRHTFLSFSRPFVTSDAAEAQDLNIDDDTVQLLWGYGETDNYSTGYCNATRGAVPRYLLDPDLTPRAVREGKMIDPGNEDVKTWSIVNTFPIPPKETTYWCRIHKLELAEKHHIIGYRMRVNNQTQGNLHQVNLFRCRGSALEYEPYVLNNTGEECYQFDLQQGGIPLQTCTELKGGYTLGSLPFFFPDSMGIPIGDTGPPEYFLMQTHYNNPQLRTDLISENSFDIFYTTKLRPNDGGQMVAGHAVPGSPSLLLPPGSTNHSIIGHCSSGCTARMFPPEGIRIVGGVIHAHTAGRVVTVHHFRGEEELPPIFHDDNWNVTYQPFRLLREEVEVLPGDQLTIECKYDTTNFNYTLVGGYSAAPQEICIFFIHYYSQLTEYTNCWSEILNPAYTARYLAGASNLTWDQSRLEYAASGPPKIAGMTVSEISDSKYVTWDNATRDQLQMDHLILEQSDSCLTYLEMQTIFATGTSPPRRSSSYPSKALKSRMSEQCHEGDLIINTPNKFGAFTKYWQFYKRFRA